MKRYLYIMLFLLQPMVIAQEKPAAQNTPTPQPVQQAAQPQKPPRDYGPEILSTFFYSIVPNFLKMALGAETANSELVFNGFAGMSQGVGMVIDLASRTPNNAECLRASKALLACLEKNKTQVMENSRFINKK